VIGRWTSVEKFAEVYMVLNPYNYAANNPINIIDEAGHLLKDRDYVYERE
jgi:RHS repeat-associated protein